MAFLVGVQMYTVRKEAKENFYGTLKKIKAMGYDGVEFAGLNGHTAEEVKEMCSDLGLVPISAHVSYDEMMQDFYAYIRGEKKNPFTYEHDYLVQKVLSDIVGGVRINGKKEGI